MLKRNLIFNFLLSVSRVLFPVITIPYLSRVLNPAGIGQVSFIDSFTSYFISVADLGLMIYGIREVARHRDDPTRLRKLVGELLTLHLVSSLFSWLIYLVVIIISWDHMGNKSLLFFSSTVLLLNFLSCEWYFIGTERFRFISLRSVSVRLLGIILMFVLVREESDFVVYYIIISASLVFSGLLNFLLLFRELRPKFFETSGWTRHISYTLYFYLLGISYNITVLLDNVLLRISSNIMAVAYYAFAVKVVRLVSGIMSENLLVFFPRAAGLIQQKEEKKAGEVLTVSSGVLLFIAIPFSIGLFIYANLFTRVYFGLKFLPVATDLQILSVYPIVHTIGIFLNQRLIMSLEKERRILLTLLQGGLLFIPLTLILSYYFADRGASVALLIAEGILFLVNWQLNRKYLGETSWLVSENIWQPLLAGLSFFVVWWLIGYMHGQDWVKLVVGIGLSLFTYSFLMVFILKNKLARKMYRSVPDFIKRARENL